MAWIEVIDEHAAEGELRTVYDDIIAKRGKMSNIMRVQSLHPKAMRAHMDLYLKILFGSSKLKRAERELIATVVSATNACDYCVHHHAEALNFYWKDDARVQQVMADYRMADLDERQRAMLDYAAHLTRNPDAMSETHVQALRDAGFSDKDVLDINLITAYFNFVNRIAAGLGVTFSEDEVSGYTY